MIKSRSALLLLVVLSFVVPVETRSADAGEESGNDYYEKGKRAYDNGDLIGAIKFLFAYKVSRGESLNSDPKFLAAVDAVIEQSEKDLRVALDNNKKRERWWAENPKALGGSFAWSGSGDSVSDSSGRSLVVKYKLLEKEIELKRLELEKLNFEAELSKNNERENKK